MNYRTLFSLFVVLTLLLSITPVFAANDVDMYFFIVPGCPHCENLRDWISTIESNHPTLNVIEVNGAQDQQMFKEFLSNYSVPINTWGQVPRVFIGNYTCLGDSPCIETLEEKITYCENNVCESPVAVEEKIDLSKLIGLAVADSVSPCELAVMTLLLTVLFLKEPEKKYKVLLGGFAFALGIYLTYFTFGLAIIFGFKSFVDLASFDKSFLYSLLAIFAIIIGLINFRDFLKPNDPMGEVPKAWRPKMNDFIKKTTSVPGAFLVGIIVSLFLTPCTIGPYFVAGGILAGVPWSSALPWLVLYDFIFILPMIILTFILYFGLSGVEKATEWRNKKAKYLHLLSAIILIGLGISMLMGWI
ncbi:MAG: GAP family protein [Nanoarchaeota archaeon]|nr:GAP family protein [Nanoarchaeota archaeon]MBU4124143.1 GAP family protein [Nanoarchaeota archaeon]